MEMGKINIRCSTFQPLVSRFGGELQKGAIAEREACQWHWEQPSKGGTEILIVIGFNFCSRDSFTRIDLVKCRKEGGSEVDMIDKRCSSLGWNPASNSEAEEERFAYVVINNFLLCHDLGLDRPSSRLLSREREDAWQGKFVGSP